MKTNTINISFRNDLLNQIDNIAKEESRSRSELIREAARMYIERKKRWSTIFKFGESLARQKKLTDEDVIREIKKYREENRK